MKFGFSVLAASFLAVSTASAATVYEFEATSISPKVDSFSVTYEDLDGDMLFSIDELLSFSGVQFNVHSNSYFDTLTGVRTVAGYTDGGDASWNFGQTTGTRAGRAFDLFSYSVTPSVVPLPAAGFMLLAGLGGIAALRRRKRG